MKTAPTAANEILTRLPTHCTYSWRLRPEQVFINSTVSINGNPNLKALDKHT
jgi:hypothetical protein